LQIYNLIKQAVDSKASDIHISSNVQPLMRVGGTLRPIPGYSVLDYIEIKDLVYSILSKDKQNELENEGEAELSYSDEILGRFRVNVYKQRGSYACAFRIINSIIPSLEELGLPVSIRELTTRKQGLILITGPSGSGKSTTLASMIDVINSSRKVHILTLEDPIEYTHENKLAMVNQREIGSDTKNYSKALKSALRQDPDVILIGEMRDLETIQTAVTAAETGHLVLSTLHTIGSADTIDRIIDVFPSYQQQQVRVQLSSVLEAIVTQRLIPTLDEKNVVGAFEVLKATSAIRNLIRDDKTYQIQNHIQTGKKYGMISLDKSLERLYKSNLISKENALAYSIDRLNLEKYLV